ncbi:MAG: GxxExxY protein [Candidatus Omnitrophica bacterium]|nr:GxxExxY protein [Candidatus Omnitrophota bacterium]
MGNAHKENVYHNAYIVALKNKGLDIEKNKHIEIFYENKKVGTYAPDLIVNDEILIELKAKPFLTKEDIRQFWHYLKSSMYKVGYLINFGSANKVEIIRRVYDTARTKI